MKKNKTLVWVLSVVLAISLSTVGYAAEPREQYQGFDVVKVVVDGREVSSDVPAVIIDGRTMVPLRLVSEALGEKVWWDGKLQAVAIGEAPVLAGPGVGPDLVKKVQAIAAKQWGEVGKFFGQGGDMPFIWVFADKESWYQQKIQDAVSEKEARKITQYAAGTADTRVNIFAKDYDVTSLSTTVAHEFGHIFISRAGLSEPMPAWFNEGFVEYAAREVMGMTPTSPVGGLYWAASRKDVLSRVVDGTVEPLFDTQEMFIDRLGQYPGHGQALLAVDFLVKRHGLQTVMRYLSLLKETKDHESSFQTAFGMGTVAFKEAFMTYLKEEAKRKTGVAVEFEAPEGFSGTFTVFPPGVTEGGTWRIASKQRVRVALDRDGKLVVSASTASERFTTNKKPTGLYIYVIPDRQLTINGKNLKDQGLAFEFQGPDWFWAGNTAFWQDGSREESTKDPSYPTGIRLLKVEPMP